jgi:ankyrin repeat domain-containing protein 50
LRITQNRSHIIEWHLKTIQSSKTKRLVFFYCSQNGGKRTSPEDVFRSLVAQLAWSVDGSSIAKSVKYEYENRKNRELSLDECRELLASLIALYQQTTVVVDALDECEYYDRLLRSLMKMALKRTPKAIKFFFSSRTNVTLPEGFPTWEKLELDSQKSLTGEDMKRYIQTEVKDRETLAFGSRLLGGKHPALEDRLVEVLARRAQGM